MEQVKDAVFTIEPDFKKKVLSIYTNNDDLLETIIDLAYTLYNEYRENINQQLEVAGKPCIRFTYYGLCEYAKYQFGSLVEFAILIGKYNQQVENGGHYQYWNNGYGSINNPHQDLYNHINLVNYFNKFKNDVTSLYSGDKLESINSTLNKVLWVLEHLSESIKWTIQTQYGGFDSMGCLSEKSLTDCYQELTDWSTKKLEYLDNWYYEIGQPLRDILNLYFNNYLLN